jgi:hypothetical protein
VGERERESARDRHRQRLRHIDRKRDRNRDEDSLSDRDKDGSRDSESRRELERMRMGGGSERGKEVGRLGKWVREGERAGSRGYAGDRDRQEADRRPARHAQ